MKGNYYILIHVIIAILVNGCNGEIHYEIEFTDLDTGSSASIRALHVINEDVIWASGTGGTFLLSVEGGESWRCDTVPGAVNDDFRSIHAWDEHKAVLFGTSHPGRAYYTQDGGKSWDIIYENNSEGIFFDSSDFADENIGLALSDPIDSCSFLIRTADGGKSWIRVDNIPVLIDGEYHFAASNSCIDYHRDGHIWIITGGTKARVFLSTDHGENWKVAETGLVHGNQSSGNFSISFCDDQNGIVVGGTYDMPELNNEIAAWSSDGGNTWNLSEIMPREYRSCVVWMQDKKRDVALSLGKTGCDYSLDKGRTWLPGADVKDYYTARVVAGTLNGFAAGSDGKIARFTVEKVE